MLNGREIGYAYNFFIGLGTLEVSTTGWIYADGSTRTPLRDHVGAYINRLYIAAKGLPTHVKLPDGNLKCPKCGGLHLRRVDTGRCVSCKVMSPLTHTRAHGGDRRATADSALMRTQPGLVLTKKQAKTVGLKVYRTGKPCKKGHTGWRYVSTGSCIDCLRGR